MRAQVDTFWRFIAITMLLLPFTVWASPGGANEKNRVDAFVQAEMERQKIPGVAIAIIRDGEVTKSQGYGFANVELKVPVTTETIFQTGSIGKMFAALTTMLLVQDGKLSIDDSISKYFPKTPAAFRQVTPRQLMTHTSGLPDIFSLKEFDTRRDYTEADILNLIFKNKLIFEPSSRWLYSSTAYTMLAILTGRVSGQSYSDFLRDRVFAPAGMKTARVVSEEEIVPNRAAGYRLVNGEIKNQTWESPVTAVTAAGAGSLYSSITDLIAWDRTLRAGSLLKPEAWAQVYTPVKLKSGKTYPYGFGWFLQTVNAHEVQRHRGFNQGYSADLLRYPKDRLTVIALANLERADIQKFTDGIVSLIAPELARPKPAPILDKEPAVAKRVINLIRASAQGKLSQKEFFYPINPAVVARHKKLLEGTVPTPESVTLFDRNELGDDRFYEYEVVYSNKNLKVTLELTPGDKVSRFLVEPK